MFYIGKGKIMSNCLYLVQSSYVSTPYMLQKISQLYQVGDCVVLMGEAVLYSEQYCLDYACAILEHDAEMLLDIPKEIKVLSYAEFADLVLTYSRCMRLQ